MNVAEDQNVKSILAPFMADLWIERRLKLHEVLARLDEKAEQSFTTRDWSQFIQFLDEHCSGKRFNLSDKQWGEFLNLMMISRKVNHKSVKFKDILANKQQIESNAHLIKSFNVLAQLGQAIEMGLNDLEQLVQSSRINWPAEAEAAAANEVLPGKLMETKNYLHDKCRPLVYRLKVSIEDERVARDPRLDGWRMRESKLSAAIRKMSEFTTGLMSLQSKLLKIKYLDQITINDEIDESKGQPKGVQSRVRESIELCRKEMRDVERFYQKIITLLRQVSSRSLRALKSPSAGGILLIKVFEPKEYISNGEIQSASDKLDKCRRKLDQIMQDLRREFGRFYFLNDLELLTIVMIDTKLVCTESQVAQENSKRIICKLFNNSISSFPCDDQRKYLIGVKSPSGEIILFADDDFVPLKKAVQVYSLEVVRILNELQRKLRKTLKFKLMQSVRNLSDRDSPDWSLPVQLINLSECVKFCSRVEHVLVPSKECKMKSLDSLIEFYECQAYHESCQQAASSCHIIASVNSMFVQFISLLMSMRHEKIAQVSDWLWQKQVRYYVCENPAPELEVRIADAKFQYKFDYLCIEQVQQRTKSSYGFISRRLIRTTITERCFLMASQAVYHLRIGANPYGPAGGGKTETIKALGQLLGQQVIVHNCDETNDIDSLDRLIWGLAHTGLWGCFDEFNRLSSSTMSVVSATLELVQSSIRENKTTVQRTGMMTVGEPLSNQSSGMMCIDKDSAFFITLNPAVSVDGGGGGGSSNNSYKGRRQLPANLRNLFLPISMVCVQIDPIIREYLLALSMDQTSDKLTKSEILELGPNMERFLQLMVQLNLGANRCEWDLRLMMASLQRVRVMRSSRKTTSGMALSQLMVEAFCSEVKPRLTPDEFEEFCKLLQQSLGRNLQLQVSGQLLSCPSTKVSHLRDQLETRAGVLLVGPTKSGKSITWRELCDRESIKWIALNPKFCSQQELFGGFFDDDDDDDDIENEQTDKRGRPKKWRDGYFTSKVREALEMLQQQPDLQVVCLVLDGPIDPDWVESLNSVLDDNRVLTLGSGERLSFLPPINNKQQQQQQSIKLILETDSIHLASPATISRLGLIYFEQVETETIGLNELRLEQMHQLTREQSLPPNWQLIIICGQQLDYQAIDQFFKQHNNVHTYSCNQHSNSRHLEDLFSWPQATKQTIILMHNVNLITGAEDQWGAKTFLELLRFSLDYGGYYDSREEFAFKSLEGVKFVLTCEKLDQMIDQRLANKSALVVHLENSTGSDGILEDDILDLRTIKDEILHSDQTNLLILNNNKIHLAINEINHQLIGEKSIEDVSVCLFDSSSKAHESFVRLDRQFERNDLRQVLYILHDFELNLMENKMKAKLWHLLNRFVNATSCRATFVFVCHADQINPTIQSIMAKKVFRLNCELANGRDLLAKTFRGHILVWLEEKIFCSSHEQVRTIDKEKMDSLVSVFLGLYHKSNSSLLYRQKALKNGLANLEEFDKLTEQMRNECKQQDEKLREKDGQIRETSLVIDSSLKTSEQQRGELDELSKQLELKRSKMLEKSELLELELAQVSPKLESSQAEVRQHLRPEALNEIRTLRAPSKTIKDILDALFILLGVRDLAWSSMKSFLASKSLRDELTNYQFEQRINKEMLTRVQQLISSRRDSFEPDQARRASKAVVPLLSWLQAALEYGRVLIKSEPLRAELQQLKADLLELNEHVNEAQADLEKISSQIRLEEQKMANLRKESEQFTRESSAIQQQLQKSHELRINLESQTIRWNQDLHRISSLLVAGESFATQDRLAKICLLAASLAFRPPSSTDLQVWLDEFDLAQDDNRRQHENWIDFICGEGSLGLVLDLGISAELLSCESSSSDEDKEKGTMRLVQLVALRQCIEFVESPWLPFISLDSSADLEEEEILESLCYGNILSRANMSYVRLQQSDLVQLEQRINRLGGSANKMICCLDVRNLATDLLDLAHFLLRVSHSSDCCKFILIGCPKSTKFEQNLARYLVKFFGSILIANRSNQKDLKQVQASILNSMLELREPILMKDLERKRTELETKQKYMKANENVLLNQLVSTTTSSSISSNKRSRENFADVVRVLDELRGLNLELANDLKTLDELNQTKDSKELEYFASSLNSARFYTNFIAPLRGFCRYSVKKYTAQLLFSSHQQKQQADVCVIKSTATATATATDEIEAGLKTNKKLIVRHAMFAMEPRQRLEFVRKLGSSGGGAEFDDAAKNEAVELGGENFLGQVAKTQLLGKTILSDVLAVTEQPAATSSRCQLIVVLHDPSKSSSPQQELDYLFGGGGGGDADAPLDTYDKVYATGDSLGSARLEAALRKFASAKDNNNSGNFIATKAAPLTGKTRFRCLCVVNAHLSTSWLNANLLDCLENDYDDSNNSSSQLRVLILIGEAASTEPSSTLFDGRLLDYAKLRYWHDELALSLIDRFDTFLGLITATTTTTCLDADLRLQLILLHVVCQERAKPIVDDGQTASKPIGWLRSYNFDYYQLNLALKTLDRLERGSNKSELRVRLSDYMADIVYGSRIESSKDELQLQELIGRFIRSGKLASDQLKLLDELRAAANVNSKDYDRLWAKLIGLPADCCCSAAATAADRPTID